MASNEHLRRNSGRVSTIPTQIYTSSKGEFWRPFTFTIHSQRALKFLTLAALRIPDIWIAGDSLFADPEVVNRMLTVSSYLELLPIRLVRGGLNQGHEELW